MRPLIYVAGPISSEMIVGTRNAILFGRKLLDGGALPFVPHNFTFWHFLNPGSYEEWMEADMAYLEHCQALVRLPGESPGADREVVRAKELGIPTFSAPNGEVEDDLWEWIKSWSTSHDH